MLTIRGAVPLLKRSYANYAHSKNYDPRQGDNPLLDNGRALLDEIRDRLSRPASVITLALTFFAFIVLSSLVEYAVTTVAVNLAAVEDTTGQAATPLKKQYSDDEDSTDPDAKDPLLDVEDAPLSPTLFPSAPITRTIRSTFRHLRATTGTKKSRFRGLGYGIGYGILSNVLGGVLAAIMKNLFPRHLGSWFGYTLAALACSYIRAAWTHATIAAPSEKDVKHWRFKKGYEWAGSPKVLYLPTIRVRLAQGLSSGVLCAAMHVIRKTLRAAKHDHTVQWYHVILAFVPLFIAGGLFLGFVLPAEIALVRTEAALLPESDTAIVPFDRTFGGKMVINTESKCDAIRRHLSMFGAWKSFDKKTYVRVLKMYVKMFWISFAMALTFLHVLLFELVLILGGMGPKILEWLKEAQEKGYTLCGPDGAVGGDLCTLHK